MNDTLGMSKPEFLFTVCQVGAEKALKAEMAANWPAFRFAYSRPGFLTFKLPEGEALAPDFDLRSVFARTHGFSLGNVSGASGESLAKEVWALAAGREFQHLHVWQRDALAPGEHGFEPGMTPLAEEIGKLLLAARGESSASSQTRQSLGGEGLSDEVAHPKSGDFGYELPLNKRARVGQQVLDVVLVEPGNWWVGWHQAASMPSRWPGGVAQIELPEHAVSRAYLKAREAILWSRLPVEAGDRAVEIGSSPGGSCQALLDLGLEVIGIDPAEMDEAVLEHPRFTHIRKRSAEVKRREFRGVKWLLADSNVAPAYTLDAVEAIVTHSDVHIRGLLLTLKLLNWELASEIPDWMARVRSWGYEHVRARQLAYNRQEICIAATKSRSMRRAAPWKVESKRA